MATATVGTTSDQQGLVGGRPRFVVAWPAQAAALWRASASGAAASPILVASLAKPAALLSLEDLGPAAARRRSSSESFGGSRGRRQRLGALFSALPGGPRRLERRYFGRSQRQQQHAPRICRATGPLSTVPMPYHPCAQLSNGVRWVRCASRFLAVQCFGPSSGAFVWRNHKDRSYAELGIDAIWQRLWEACKIYRQYTQNRLVRGVACCLQTLRTHINQNYSKKALAESRRSAKAELKAALHCNKIHSAAVQRRLYIYIYIDVVAASAALLQKRGTKKS